jgi:ribosomal protein L37E
MKGRRKADKGNWYANITPTPTTTAACSRCGTKTAYLDQQHSECLKCVLERRKQAREATPAA